MSLKDYMEKEYRENKKSVFTFDHLFEEVGTSVADGSELLALKEDGLIDKQVELWCPEDHHFETKTNTTFSPRAEISDRCEMCKETYSRDQINWDLWFAMTDKWKDQFDESGS